MPRAKKKKTREGFTATKNKKMRNWTMYYNKVLLLKLAIKTVNNAGYVLGYKLQFVDKIMTGLTVQSLKKDLQNLIKDLGLQKMTDLSKEAVILYIDKLDKIRGFFKDEITDDYGKTVEIYDFIECREWCDWTIDEDITKLQEIVNKVFIPEKYFYLTPNQRTRKQLLKNCDTDIYKEIYPADYIDYQALRKGLFGGICYVKSPGLPINHDMICLDIKSAYIYSLLLEKHCMSKRKVVDPKYYEYYLDAKDESSFGLYEIKYSTASTIISCYKDIDGKNFQKGEQTVKVWMDSVDLKLFIDLPKVYVHNIECKYLEKYDMDYLPNYVKQYLVQEYNKKLKIDEDKEPALYRLQKVSVNGIYGNTIKLCNSKDEFFKLRTNNALAPQWGIWTTSYTKKLLINLAIQLQGWYYSDTDSIYCLDTSENREIIKKYNLKIQQKIKEYCKDDKELYEIIKDLGTFEEKYQIKKFKALKQKEYLFTTKDTIDEKGEIVPGKIIVKAAGCNKKQMPDDDSLYELDKLPVGTKIFPKINTEKTTAIIDGKTYVSNGSYYEKACKGKEAEFELWQIAMINEFFK